MNQFVDFLSTYTVSVALPNIADLGINSETDLVIQLQRLYDRSIIVSGTFKVQVFGNGIAIITFQRDLEVDADGFGLKPGQMTIERMLEALRDEVQKDSLLDVGLGLGLNRLCQALGQQLTVGAAKVEGLGCQYPRLRVQVEVAFKNEDARNSALGRITDPLNTAAQDPLTNLADSLGGVVLDVQVECLPGEETPKYWAEQPAAPAAEG